MKGVWHNPWGNGHTAYVPFDLGTKFALTDLGRIPGKGWGRVIHTGNFLVYPSVGHGQGMVYAVSKDGKRKWKTPLERGKQFEFANPCIMVTDHCIVVVQQRFVDGLDVETGEREWRVEAPDDAPAYVRGAEPFKHGIQECVDGRTVVVGGGAGSRIWIDSKDGAVTRRDRNHFSTLKCVAGYGIGMYAVNWREIPEGISKRKYGEWNASVGEYRKQLARIDDPDTPLAVYERDLPYQAAPVFDGDRLIAFDFDRGLIGYELRPEFREAWRNPIRSDSSDVRLALNGKVLVGASNGNYVRIDPRTGKDLWSSPAEDGELCEGIMGNCFLLDHKHLYAIGLFRERENNFAFQERQMALAVRDAANGEVVWKSDPIESDMMKPKGLDNSGAMHLSADEKGLFLVTPGRVLRFDPA